MAFSDPVQLAIISSISGVVIAYLGYLAKTRVDQSKAKKQPKDRMEQMFDGYERLIKQKDIEDDRKQAYIQTIEKELTLVKEHANSLEIALDATSTELAKSRDENKELKEMLEAMRKEYKIVKEKN